MTSSWYLTRPVAGSGPVVAWRGPSAAAATTEPTPIPAPSPAPRPARGAVRSHRPRPARPPRRSHHHTQEALA